MAAVTTLTTGPHANSSTTASFTGCGQCTYIQIVDPAIGRWNNSAPNNISALRITQLFVDKNHSTTSTSVVCNTSALGQYPTSAEDARIPYASPLYGLDDECNLLVTWGALDLPQSSGGRSGIETYPVTATMTGQVGEALFLGPYIYVYGAVSTTDSMGSPICLSNTDIDFTTPIGHYTDPYTRTVTSVLPDDTSKHEISGTFLLLPELSKYVQGFDAVFEQCTLVNPGGSPIALTPANEIILPAITIPASQPVASPTTTSTSKSAIKTRLPSTSNVPIVPASSTTPPRADPASTTTVVHDRPESTSGVSMSRPDPGTGEDDMPTQPSNPPSQSPPDEHLPAQPTFQAPADQPPSSSAVSIETMIPALGPANSASPGDIAQEPSNSPHRPSLIVPVGPSAQQSRPTTRTQPAIEILPVSFAAASNAVVATSRVTTVQDIGTVITISDTLDAYAIGSTITLRAGGPAAAISGTLYSALPSGSGVIAVDEPSDPFASLIAAGISGQNVGAPIGRPDGDTYVIENGVTLTAGREAAILSGTTFTAFATGGGVVAVANGQSTTHSTFPGTATSSEVAVVALQDNEGAFVVAGSFTISQGEQAATISGTTYSALPSGSGVVIAADGQTTTLDAMAMTAGTASNEANAYVIGGSSTISAGGSAIELFGTTFSALPSGSGVVAVVDGKTTTLAKTAIEQSAAVLNTYIIAGSATISAGGSATALSGTTYSALPSGAGVAVIADGESSTLRPDGSAETTSTGNADDKDVASFTGSASTSSGQLQTLAFFAANVLLLALVM